MRAYSIDLRRRMVEAVDAGLAMTEVARAFRVSRSTVRNYVARRRHTGSLAPKPRTGRPPSIHPKDYPALIAQLDNNPEATLAEHCRQWERTHGVRVSITAMHRTIARTGWRERQELPAAA